MPPETWDERPLYGGYERHDWITMHISAFVSILLSVTGSLYIVVEAFIGHTRKHRIISDLKVFPVFISICDLCLSLSHSCDYIFSAVTGRVLSGVPCLIVGSLFTYFINAMAMWVGATAYYIWKVVMLGESLRVGRIFWKMQAVCWGVPFIAMIPPLASHSIGDGGVYCALARSIGYLPPLGVIGLFQFTFIAGASIVCFVCYGLSIIIMRKSIKFLDALGHNSQNAFQVNAAGQAKGVCMKILSAHLSWFLLVYLLIWTPFIIYTMVTFKNTTNKVGWQAWMIFQYNFGGLLNAVAYGYLLGRPTALSLQNDFTRQVMKKLRRLKVRLHNSTSLTQAIPNLGEPKNITELQSDAKTPIINTRVQSDSYTESDGTSHDDKVAENSQEIAENNNNNNIEYINLGLDIGCEVNDAEIVLIEVTTTKPIEKIEELPAPQSRQESTQGIASPSQGLKDTPKMQSKVFMKV